MYFRIYIYIFRPPEWSGHFNHRTGSFALSVITNAPPTLHRALLIFRDNIGTIPPFSPILVARLLLCIFGIRTDKGIAKGRVITARFLQYGLSTNGHLIFAPPTTTYYTSVLCLRRLSSDSGGSNTLSWHPSGWLPPFLAFLSFMMK